MIGGNSERLVEKLNGTQFALTYAERDKPRGSTARGFALHQM
jgi:hypothetical protein